MKILDRYIFSLFFRFFAGGVAVLATLFILIMFFEVIGDFVGAAASMRLMAAYLFYKTPEAVYYMTPMAALGAAILALSVMAKNRESMVLMSCGVSALRITRPIVIGALLISAGTFMVGEMLIPPSWSAAEDIFRHRVKKVSEVGAVKQNMVWITMPGGEIWNINFLDLENRTIHDVKVIVPRPDKNGFASVTYARYGRMEEKEWVFSDVIERRFGPEGEITETLYEEKRLPLVLGLEELKHAEKKPEQMNLAEIRRYIDHIRRSGYDDIRFTVDMYVKITFPLISVVMALIAVPFGLKMQRTAGPLAGVTSAVIIGFSFWFLFSMGVSMGHSGKIPPLAAAAGAHALFAAFSLYAIIHRYHAKGGFPA